ncbi:MAG: response regulator transcription factor [Paludibacteraceae bacterium]|nr:response regulator transcription factor [Paludibacteraceae bacterium]
MIYRENDKMSELLTRDRKAMQIVNRFGIPLGVGDKTIDAICRQHGIHTPTFLAIVNHETYSTEIDLPTLQTYLKNAHTYFLEFLLPRLRRQLIEAITPTDQSDQVAMLILRYFDEYVQEIRIHIQHEDEGQLEEHATDDQHIAKKLQELVSLIIKYYPAHSSYPFANELLTTVLLGIYQTEEELQTHCAIEDEILRPAMKRKTDRCADRRQTAALTDGQEELSEREKEVVTLVVQGLINKEIADKLHLSLHTVIAHRKNIARKLNIHSTAGLTIYAIVNKLIEV